MNRLWVRLSLMISGVLFLVFFLQFLSIMADIANPDQTGGPGLRGENDLISDEIQAERLEIARRLVNFGLLSLVVGTAGGVVISRVISAPINNLVEAAHRVGKGDLNTRVRESGSQEFIELANTFNKMIAELQHSENQRNNLTADISHELRTPLTVLEGNLRAALDHVYELNEAEIANLYGQTRHLIRLVNDLRELSLAEARQLTLEKQPANLNNLISEIVQALEPLTAEKEVALVNQMPELPPIQVDGVRIRQVLFNLLTNALRHTPPGGEIKIYGNSQQERISITVQDSGEGLDADQLKSVFDRFYRVDRSRSRETGGTGLGLAIVKAIVEAHGGEVEAYSMGRGSGSAFSIHLPL